MRKLAKFKLTNIFLAAIFILNQAVFLSIPVLAGQTQTNSYIASLTDTTISDTTTSTTDTSYTTDSATTITYSEPSMENVDTTDSIIEKTLETTYAEPTTATDGSNIIFEDIITDTAETPSLSILIMDFVSPPAKVSGQPSFSVKTSELAEVMFYAYKDGAEINRYSATYKGENTYSFNLDTRPLANGQYTIKAYAKKSGYIDISKQINITVDNPVISTFTTDNDLTSAKTVDSTIAYEITFAEAYQPPLSGEKRITASLNNGVDGVDFSIEGPRSYKYSGLRDNDRQYYFMWNTPNFPNGYYKVTANARVAGIIKTSRSFSIQIINNGTTSELLSSAQLQTSDAILQVQPELLSECKKNNITSIEECQKFMNIPPQCREKGLLSQEECNKFMAIPPQCREKGLLSQEECNKFMAIPPQCREKGILDKTECEKYSYQFSMPDECKKAGVTTTEECNKIIFLNSLPDECKKAGVKTKEECEKIMKSQISVTSECQKAKITDPAACDKYMAQNFMAPECRQAGITTMEECNYILREKISNLNVVVKIELKTERGTEILEVELPEECQRAGASSAEECEKMLFKKNAPQECLDANINTAAECERFIFKKSAPADCKEAGILTSEACKKYMFEKYKGAENIPTDKFPVECQKAGANTAAECEKIMQKTYLPKDCQDQGITDEAKCYLYLQQKNMPKDCLAAGAKTRSECDKIMFKKYGAKECLAVGIEDEKKCEDFMFNKYAPQVTCQGIDGWQCKNSIRENHLGNIIAKQIKYQELGEKVAHLTGNSITQEELKASLDLAKEMVPLKEGKTGLKVLGTEIKLTLDEGDNLIQTGPIALMIDSDQDGLPDDMERRFGTDPFKADTDGDGYDDGAEVKNNYNPLGEGKLGKVLAPIEEAIMGDKKLEHPKSEGEISKNLSVDSISNILDENDLNRGYSLEGIAEPDSIITLYLYSDLPLIATVKADEYGNWQYELSQSLIEGEHEVYVALNDNTGKIIAKGNPLNFFIKEAKAASVGDFISETVAPTTPMGETNDLIRYYVIIASLIMAVGILLFIVFIIQKGKQT
ncbi:MAG: hypothetical protein PHQ42_00345 [Patescibacteria group bacterium]|nr:hypothetical protein [Patescibacteria group bacterium]